MTRSSLSQIPDVPIVRLRGNRSMPGLYDVEMAGIEGLQGYDHVECHVVLYPYSRRVNSGDITFYPFEEYVKDVLSNQRSAYAEIRGHFNEVFGLLLGLLIAVVFAAFKPEDLLSVESIVSVFAAYTIGKELWDDIERTLIGLSKNWRLRLQDSYYRYQLERHSTLAAYALLAKRRRYGKSSLLPERIDFIKQSNSQTLRMCFDMRDWRCFAEPSGHVHSIHVDPAVLSDFQAAGFMFGVKLSLNRGFLGFSRCLELFQSIDNGSTGCLDGQGEWVEGALFCRNTLTWGRVKYYLNTGLVHGQTIVAVDLPGRMVE